MSEKHVCCLCGKEFTGFGNNPYPLDDTPNARCCDKCNDSVVVARMYLKASRQVCKERQDED